MHFRAFEWRVQQLFKHTAAFKYLSQSLFHPIFVHFIWLRFLISYIHNWRVSINNRASTNIHNGDIMRQQHLKDGISFGITGW